LEQIIEYPINTDNEATIIVSILQKKDIHSLITRTVSYDRFRTTEFRAIMWAIDKILSENLEFTIDTVLLKTQQFPEYKVNVDHAFILQLMDTYTAVPEENLKIHIEQLVLDNIKIRLLKWLFSSIYKRCLNSKTTIKDIEESIKYAREIIDNSYSATQMEFMDINAVADQFEAAKMDKKDKWSCGYSQLDMLLTEGFKPGQITTITALAGMGKSSFCLSIMKNLSHKSIPSAQFALEMNSTSLFAKLLAFNTRLPITTTVKHPDRLSEVDRKIYEDGIKVLRKNKKIFLNDKPMQSIASMKEQIMLLQDFLYPKGGSGYIVVPIDLFGKLREFQGSDNFARDYEKKCNEIQAIARELAVHFILVAQINREVSRRRNKRPTMNDLKNAHALTEISDIIFGIHRPFFNPEKALKFNIAYGINVHNDYDEYDYMKDESDMHINEDELDTIDDIDKNVAEIIILKQRMGITNILRYFIFDPETTCFYPVSEEYHRILIEKNSEE